MNSGFIKLWRCSMDSRVWRNEGLWKMWCWCLLKASHKDRWTSIRTGRGETEIEIKAGQFIFGRNKAATELKVKPETARKRLEKLKTIGNLTTQPTPHFTIVTICNWGAFQDAAEAKVGREYQPSTNQVPTKYQPSTTDKNVKKVKNVKKKTYGEFKNVLLTDSENEKLKAKFNGSYDTKIYTLSEYMARTGKSYKSHYLTVLKWAKDEKPKQSQGDQRQLAKEELMGAIR